LTRPIVGEGEPRTLESASPGLGSEDLPEVCVVVRTYQVGPKLEEVLDAVSELDYPRGKVRLVVAATSGDDNAKECLESFRAAHSGVPSELLVIDANSADVGRNAGIRTSDCEYVLVIDDDVVLDHGTLRRLMEVIQGDQSTAAVASPAVDEAPTLAGRLHFGRYLGRICSAYTVMPCTLFRKSLAEGCGLYREDMGPPFSIHEDWEFGTRLRRHGYRVIVDGQAVSRHLKQQGGRVHAGDSPSSTQAKLGGKKGPTGRISGYVSSYLHRGWWSMLQVMKVSPPGQAIEYAGYALIPILLLFLLAFDFRFGLAATAVVLAGTSLYALVRGQYSAYGLERRLSYPIILTSIRSARTYLFLLGIAVNAGHLGKRP